MTFNDTKTAVGSFFKAKKRFHNDGKYENRNRRQIV